MPRLLIEPQSPNPQPVAIAMIYDDLVWVFDYLQFGSFSVIQTRKMKCIECLYPCRVSRKNSGSLYQHGVSCKEYSPSAKDYIYFIILSVYCSQKYIQKFFKPIHAGKGTPEIYPLPHSTYIISLIKQFEGLN